MFVSTTRASAYVKSGCYNISLYVSRHTVPENPANSRRVLRFFDKLRTYIREPDNSISDSQANPRGSVDKQSVDKQVDKRSSTAANCPHLYRPQNGRCFGYLHARVDDDVSAQRRG